MKYLKAQGFVVRRINFGESDKLITVFTEKYGKIRALAKGVRKVGSRRASHLEIFNQVKFNLYQGKSFYYLTDAGTVNPFLRLRQDLIRVAAAYQLCEVVERLCPEKQVQPLAYHLLKKGLEYLDQVGKEVQSTHLLKLTRRFTQALLFDSGFVAVTDVAEVEKYLHNVLERKLSAPVFFALAARK